MMEHPASVYSVIFVNNKANEGLHYIQRIITKSDEATQQ